MDLSVFLAVLGAALCHAAWNAGLKLRVDPGVAVVILALASGAFAVPLLFITGLPGQASWGYLAASVVVHVFYFTTLAEAYRSGDLGQVYPIARGTAPLLTAAGSLLVLGEVLKLVSLAGLVLLTAGVLLLSLGRGRAASAPDRRGVFFALLTAVIIALYTLIDGRGAQVSGNAHAYAVAFFALNGVSMGVVGYVRQRDELRTAMAGVGFLVPFTAGALSFVSYWVALWAMTKAPIALVAALRETSVLFAAGLSVVLLKEPLMPSRILAAFMVLGGLVLIRLA